jgi:ADP-ribosyl-[dinitrogen reductase] hydrolase
MLGGAVGDALGAPVEFMTRSQILRAFGPEGLTDYAPAYGGIGTITDDTQMSLFTAEGLVRAYARWCWRGISGGASVVGHAYQRWLHTQGLQNPQFQPLIAKYPGWLLRCPALHQVRAPGRTCLDALMATTHLSEPARNHSKGCGGIMRIAPVGLYAARRGWELQASFNMGVELAALTHGHPTGQLAAGVFAVLIQCLAGGLDLEQAVHASLQALCAAAGHEEVLNAIEHVHELRKRRLPHQLAIELLGQGWVAEEALGIALYCAYVARDFRHGVLLAVNHGGDSDSTGALTGNLLGARDGQRCIPASWLQRLELRRVIRQMASDLYHSRNWDIGLDCEDQVLNEHISRRYPGN